MKKEYNYQKLGVHETVDQRRDMIYSCQCPACACRMSKVVETRSITIGEHMTKVRVRECRNCKKHFKTGEVADQQLKLPTKSRAKPKNLNLGDVFE